MNGRRTPALGVICSAALWIVACEAGQETTQGATDPKTETGSQDQPANPATAALLEKLKPGIDQANGTGATKPAAPQDSDPSKSPIPRISDDIEELTKLPERVLTAEEAELVAAADILAQQLAEALRKGDEQAIRASFVTKDDLEEIVTAGMLDILSSMGHAGAKTRIAALIRAIENKSGKISWDPGRLHETPDRPNIWVKKTPMLIGALLTIEIEGAPILVQLDQVLYTKSGWKVLRMR